MNGIVAHVEFPLEQEVRVRKQHKNTKGKKALLRTNEQGNDMVLIVINKFFRHL